MRWVWRGDYLPATRNEYDVISTQLTYERVGDQAFNELPEDMQAKKVRRREEGREGGRRRREEVFTWG